MRWLLLLGLVGSGCDGARRPSPTPAAVSEPSATLPAQAKTKAAGAESEDGPLRVETFQPASGPPTFVLRGPRGAGRIVFLHGMCGHGLGYAQAFPRAAAAHGTLIAPQADVSCGGPWSKWSANLVDLDRRIAEAFAFAGRAEPLRDVWVIGLSQGATRAADLARKWPERYTHLVGIAAPTAIRVGELRGLRAAVMMAGDRDRRDVMQQSQRALRTTGVPALFLLMPEAPHGSLGRAPETTMAEALTFLSAYGPH
jgi:pimeloyl-ACP methyl ester carboxylesterase